MRFLLIEDDEEKCQAISNFLEEQFSPTSLEIAHSFNAGLRALIRSSADTILLLDMTMPNFDATSDDPSGGAPEHFAGRDILTQMKLREILVPTIVITMFDSFGENPEKMSFAQLEEQLTVRFSPVFRGMVYYSASQESWKSLLSSAIKRIVK